MHNIGSTEFVPEREGNLAGGEGSDLNEILRGEISAVEAYEQVLEKVNKAPETYRLREFHDDHEEACRFWREQLQLRGSLPSQSSSIWGTVVEAFVGASKLLGEETALQALKNGEEHGLNEYKKLLESKELSSLQKNMIKERFIPMQERHIDSINALIKM